MRKFYIAILLFAFIAGCEKNFDGVVDVNKVSYQVTSLDSLSNFTYATGDSLITIFLYLNSSKYVAQVFCNVIASDDNKLNNDPVILSDNGTNGDETAGDNKFTALFPMSHYYPQGTYTINYFVTDNEGSTKQVASSQFTYDNGQSNVAPVISNLVLPDTVARSVSFIFTVTANDSNGLNDIDVVYFELYRPDNTLVEDPPGNTKLLMHDDGDFEHYGDDVAGDGIFSYKNSFSSTASTGTWRFVFHAKDRGGLLSNTVEKYVVVNSSTIGKHIVVE
jgi:hypothetical protein